MKVRYYTAKLKSDDVKERVAGVDGLMSMGAKGKDALRKSFAEGDKSAQLVINNWENVNHITVVRGGDY